MITVTNRIATITIDGSETVKFNTIYPVIAVKGDSITATLIKGIDSDAAEGIYSTSDGNGYTIIDNHTMVDTLYLTGTGDVRMWAGTDPMMCPFVGESGGGDAPVIEELNVNENGTYTAPSGADGYNPVIVEVPAPTPSVATKHIRGNGIFSATDDNVDGYSSVIVDGASKDAFYEIITLNDPSKLSIKISTGVSGGKALVQWGDGTEQYTLNDNAAHTYPAIGTYAIAIYPIDADPKSMQYPRIQQGTSEYRTDFFRIADYKASTINAGGGYNYSYIPQIIEIMLPAGVTTLADGDFTGITTLEKVYMQDTTPPTMAYSWAIPFGDCPNLTAIYVPVTSVNAYKSAAGWSTYASIIQPMPL